LHKYHINSFKSISRI